MFQRNFIVQAYVAEKLQGDGTTIWSFIGLKEVRKRDLNGGNDGTEVCLMVSGKLQCSKRVWLFGGCCNYEAAATVPTYLGDSLTGKGFIDFEEPLKTREVVRNERGTSGGN